MTRIRTMAVAAILVLGFAGVASAQGGGYGRGGRGPGMRGERARHGELMKELNLSDAQNARIKAIHEKYQTQFKAMRDQNRPKLNPGQTRQRPDSATREQFRRNRQALRQRFATLRLQEQNEVRAVLTSAQRTKFDARIAERKKRFDERKQQIEQRRGKYRGTRS
jgi:Spy/CpxP family protein refolding chaperone